MALEAVVYPQPQGHHFGYGRRDSSYALPWSSWCDTAAFFGVAEPCANDEWDPFLLASLVQDAEGSGEEVGSDGASPAVSAVAPEPVMQQAATTARRKRRRTKIVKNDEEIESQRMTHIAVERNRRRQMNEYLAVLRSLMPPSYALRGDQASIVGGAINYVRELEHILQSLEVQKSIKDCGCNADDGGRSPFAGFFSFPQYSTSSASHGSNGHRIQAESTATADIEASMVEGHASLKVQVQRRPRQLHWLTAGLQQLGLTTLHLNVSTAGATAMYSFSLKLEDECKLTSVEEIAEEVHEILGKIQKEQAFVDTRTGL
ncbi:hypothetical protein EJB05_22500, partial [Eragrostis curvula]